MESEIAVKKYEETTQDPVPKGFVGSNPTPALFKVVSASCKF